MGKFGCRLYCWGCGGCCLATGIVMGILATLIPPAWMASIQEGAFDLAFIDDTSQSESEGLFSDAGVSMSEADAFKAWGKTIQDGFNDCLKADFAFDWAKSPEDCIDGLHPTFSFYNASNPGSWIATGKLEVQEVGFLTPLKDTQKIEPDTSYWDETGKARFRISDKYTNDPKCDAICEEFSAQSTISTLNLWYGVFAMLGLGDGWLMGHAMTLKAPSGSTVLDAYMKGTETVPMDPHSALPVATKVFARAFDFTMFVATPNAPKLGTVELKNANYESIKNMLLGRAQEYMAEMAPTYGTPAEVVPIIQRTTPDAILGWGEVPAWADPISGALFTYNFIGGATKNEVAFGAAPSAFIEEQMSSAYYHEGLAYVVQHYEAFGGVTTYNHSCAWDPDCNPTGCFPTEVCNPLAAVGYDGGKTPGTYFGSPKGAAGVGEFTNFILTYYLVFSVRQVGRSIVQVKYKGPDREEGFDFEGLFAHTSYKAATWTRRLENCNYPTGRDVGGLKDMPGIDCNYVKDVSPLMPFFGLPLFWNVMIRQTSLGWDPALANADDGASTSLTDHIAVVPCPHSNKFCTTELPLSGDASYTTLLHYGYEPNLGALVDVTFTAGVSWKLTLTPWYGGLAGFKHFPIFWFWNYLHLPAAINMDLAKLQLVPAALNGFYVFLMTQCLVSLVGGIACCFCGV